MNNTKLSISKGRLIELLAAEIKLNILECDGVDNWTWYMEGRAEEIRELMEVYGRPNGEDDEDLVSFEDMARQIIEQNGYDK